MHMLLRIWGSGFPALENAFCAAGIHHLQTQNPSSFSGFPCPCVRSSAPSHVLDPNPTPGYCSPIMKKAEEGAVLPLLQVVNAPWDGTLPPHNHIGLGSPEVEKMS